MVYTRRKTRRIKQTQSMINGESSTDGTNNWTLVALAATWKTGTWWEETENGHFSANMHSDLTMLG